MTKVECMEIILMESEQEREASVSRGGCGMLGWGDILPSQPADG